MNYREPSASCVQSNLFGELSTVLAIAAARLRRVSWSYAHLIEHANLGADPIPELEFDQAFGVVILRCRDGTCGGAWIGVDQALAWCGEWCGLPIPELRQCAISACYAYQISVNTKQMRSMAMR